MLKRWALFGMVSMHVQVVIGLILYFMSANVQFGASTMSNSILRFFTVEHISMMLIAVILITMGHSRAKHAESGNKQGKTLFWFYLVGLILILAAIPWPFRGLGSGWF